MDDKFERTTLLIGKDNMEILKKTHIAIFGLGGVGGQLINLARTGISHIDLYDGDIVSASNINRQIIANERTIGKNKVDIAKKMILEINPNCEVKTYNQFLYPKDIEKIDFSKYQYVIDCIDTISSKLAIIKKCNQENIKLISCLGTGNKLDGSKLEITDIYKTSICPLAKIIRHEVRKLGIKKLKICYSKEEPLKVVASSKYGRHSPGSIVFVPAIAGLLIGNEVVKDLLKRN